MFGKIKGKLNNIFKKNEDVIEENPDEIVEVEKQLEVNQGAETQDAQEKVENDAVEENKTYENLEETEKKEESPLGDFSEDDVLEELEIEEEKKEKKGFFKRIFSKKEKEEELEEIKEVEDSLLENVDEQEKEAILKKKDLPKEVIDKNLENLDSQISNEEELEKEVVSDIDNSHTIVENVLDEQSKKEDNLYENQIEENQKNIQDDIEDKVSDRISEKLNSSSVGSSGLVSKFVSKIKKKAIQEEDFEKIWIELEIFLLEINIAYEIVEKIERKLKSALVGHSFDRFSMSEKIREIMVDEVEDVLQLREADFLDEIISYKQRGELLKIMMLGVNGTGKTTSIAKLIHFLKKHDFSLVVAASDTFRAAAVDQLADHCKRLDVKVIQHKGGSDPAAVAFDAVEHAQAKKLDIVLIDTAGRMPNNANLMMELQKVKRVSKSQMAMFVGDSISGNDLIDQINLFDKGVEINGVMLTKVDTDERPGSVVTTAYSINKPIYFLGIGQNYEDLVVFRAREVAEKLFDLEED